MIKKFLRNTSGNIALSVAIFAVPLFAATGAAIDYAMLNRAKFALQDATDHAALTSAKELSLSNAQDETIKAVAKNHVFTSLSKKLKLEDGMTSVIVDPVVSEDRKSLTMNLAYYWKPMLLQYFGKNVLPIKVTTTATLAGSGTICMIGLDEKKEKTIYLRKNASLEASGCGVYSNSTDKEAIKVEDNASLSAGITCSAGGVKGAKKASFEPEPVIDCPRIADPLINRTPPQKPVGECKSIKSEYEFNSGVHSIQPGYYCKGLKVKGTAKVMLDPGVYYIENSKLEVTDTATFEGEGVGFFLSGHEAKLSFKKETTISLTAPTTGVMAGMLIFEDRTASKIEKHEITSDNARLLLGTIYLPNGTLRIDSEGPIADESAYTAIIARAIELDEGPTLHLNSDYEATDVPVPEGLIGDKVYISR